MRFLANENFPLLSVQLLRQADHDTKSVIEDSPGSDDEQVLAFANDDGRIILTFDRDYGELIYRHGLRPPAGIVYFRFAPACPEEPAEILCNIVGNENLSLAGKFTVVERGRVRQRTLPGSR